jgi:hypothetical protein
MLLYVNIKTEKKSLGKVNPKYFNKEMKEWKANIYLRVKHKITGDLFQFLTYLKLNSWYSTLIKINHLSWSTKSEQ